MNQSLLEKIKTDINQKLEPLSLPHLRHAELAQFVTRLLKDVEDKQQTLGGDEILVNQFAFLKEALRAYETELGKEDKRSKIKKNSRSLREADKLRDDDLTSLRESIKPYRLSKRQEQRAAYKSLKPLFDDYKKTARANHEAATGQIRQLLAKLSAEPYQTHVRDLDIKPFVTELSQSEASFEALFAQQSLNNINNQSVCLQELREIIEIYYKQLADYVHIQSQLNKETFYKDVLLIINNSRHYYGEMLARRRGQSKRTSKTNDKEALVLEKENPTLPTSDLPKI